MNKNEIADTLIQVYRNCIQSIKELDESEIRDCLKAYCLDQGICTAMTFHCGNGKIDQIKQNISVFHPLLDKYKTPSSPWICETPFWAKDKDECISLLEYRLFILEEIKSEI